MEQETIGNKLQNQKEVIRHILTNVYEINEFISNDNKIETCEEQEETCLNDTIKINTQNIKLIDELISKIKINLMG